MRLILLVACLAACTSDGGGDDPPPIIISDGAPTVDSGGAADAADPGTDQGAVDMTAVGDMAAANDMAVPDEGAMIAMGLDVGQRAPDFTLLDHTGAQVALSDYRGRPVLIAGASQW